MPQALCKAAASKERVELAFDLLVHDRTKCESFCDWTEVTEALAGRAQLVDHVMSILNGQVAYAGFTCQMYQLPKKELVSRRLVYIPFRDALVRLALILEVADRLDPKMIEASFANRRARGASASKMFLAPWSLFSLPMFYAWRGDVIAQYGTGVAAIVTDLSSFYDMIGHEAMLARLVEEGALAHGGRDYELMRLALRPKILHRLDGDTHDTEWLMTQGICTGGAPDAFLSNVFIMEVDRAMNELPGVSYGRYCDDILIVGKDEVSVRRAFSRLQAMLHAMSLAINAGKTELVKGADAVRAKLDVRELSHERYGEDYDDEGADIDAHAPYLKDFDADNVDSVHKDASGFCKYLGMGVTPEGTRRVPLDKRNASHLQRLREIAQTDIRAGKHAAWLLVEMMASSQVPPAVRGLAKLTILELLEGNSTRRMAGLRLVHHLVARTKDGERKDKSWCQTLFTSAEQQRLRIVAAGLAAHNGWPERRSGEALLLRLGVAQ